MNLMLVGPPGSGKTTVGKLCAEKLDRRFVDVDEQITAKTGHSIPEIFSEQGEMAFRALESKAIVNLTAQDNLVIAPGGGALMDPTNRAAMEHSGLIVCLRANVDTILKRLEGSHERPLLKGDSEGKTRRLMSERKTLYDSFPVQIDTDRLSAAMVAQLIVAELLPFQELVTTPSGVCPVVLGETTRLYLPRLLREQDLPEPHLIVTDTKVGPLWAEALGAKLGVPIVRLPAGEASKTMDTVRELYETFLQHGLERQSLVMAIGGGVVGDVCGFAAATYMRGIRWVNVPTTMLSMVDASIGGKVAVDLKQGKNLVGAFHPASMVIADPDTLSTLPPEEYASGLAEVLKHGIIDDPELFIKLSETQPITRDMIQRAIAVKLRIVRQDPLEHGERAKLNLGHTIGHGIEAASDYTLRHGEAISIGIVAETNLAELMGLAEKGLASKVTAQVEALGLPTSCPGLSVDRIRKSMSSDKKKIGGELTFALPIRIGRVEYGIRVNDELLQEVISAATD